MNILSQETKAEEQNASKKMKEEKDSFTVNKDVDSLYTHYIKWHWRLKNQQ